MKPKYHNSKVKTEDGLIFDSRREWRRWLILKDKESRHEIKDLRRQVKYELIPHAVDRNKKVVERAVYYIADFVYTTADGLTVVEDVKGMKTSNYVIKRKLMLYRYGIQIREV